MSYRFALLDRLGPVAVVTMNRPERLNALSEELEIDVSAALLEAEADDAVRCIILAGAGRAFCAGHDLQADREREPPTGIERAAGVRRRTGRLLRATLFNHKPVIARVHGICLVAGVDLMSSCDFAVASEDARFGYAHLRTTPHLPSTLWPWQIGLARAKELLFTGDMLTAARAEVLGAINHTVPRDELEPFTHRLAMRIALGSSHQVQKRWLNSIAAHGLGLNTALEGLFETWEHDDPDEAADSWRARLRAEGVRAAVDWRNARFRPYEEPE